MLLKCLSCHTDEALLRLAEIRCKLKVVKQNSFWVAFELLCIVMKSDEEFSDMSDKTILIDCLNENVISPIQKF